MNEFRKRIRVQVPACLVDKSNMVTCLAFSVLFALVFLTVYSPFSTTSWFVVGKSYKFLLTAFFVVTGTCFLVFSRVLMSYLVNVKRHFSVGLYVAWLFSEIVLIGLFNAILSSVYGSGAHSFGFLLMKSIIITLFALGIPFVVTNLLFLVRDTRKMLMLTNTGAVASDDESVPKNVELINIMDNTGHLKLSVRLDNLYYIKSDDNYIKVYYIKKGELCNYMLRCKLQSIEDTLPENGSLMRCHRSYIVNIQKVKVLRNESDGFYMDFDYVGIEPIPVSKTYADKVVNRLSNH